MKHFVHSLFLFLALISSTQLIQAQGCDDIFVSFDIEYDPAAGIIGFFPTDTPDPIEWVWDFGDGSTTSTDWIAYHSYSESGLYIVCLTAFYAEDCVKEYCATIEVIGGPAPCEGYATNFEWEWIAGTNSVAFASSNWEVEEWWLWTSGDGVVISDNNDFTYTFPGPGTYTVCLTSGFGEECVGDVCYDIVVGGVIPYDGFEAGFEYSLLCDPAPTPCLGVFEGFATLDPEWGYWLMPDGTTMEGLSAEFVFEEAGIYTVCFVAGIGEECVSTFCQEIVVGDVDPCEDSFVVFEWEETPSGGIVFYPTSIPEPIEWVWDFGDGSSSGEWITDHNYAAPGVYSVCLTVWYADDCSETVCYEVTVGGPCDLFEASFEWYPAMGTTMVFENTSGDLTLWTEWWLDGILIGNEYSLVYTFPEPGWYYVCMATAISPDCVDEVCYEVYVGEDEPCGDFEASFDWTWIPGTTIVEFGNTSGELVSWTEWWLAGELIGDGNTLNYEFPEPGWYTICMATGLITDCVDEICLDILVGEEEPCIDFSLGFDYEITCDPFFGVCTGIFEAWSVPAVADWYTWEVFDGMVIDGPVMTYTFPAPGVYVICLTAGYDGDCVETFCQEVFVGDDPCEAYLNFEYEYIPETGEVVFFPLSEPDPMEFVWHFGDGTSSGEDWMASHTYLEPGVYEVCLEVWFYEGCDVSICHEIIIGDDPCDFFEASFEWEQVPGTTTVQFYNTSSDDVAYTTWWYGGTIIGNENTLTYTFPEPGTYTICMDAALTPDCIDEVCYDIVVGEGGPCAGFSGGFDYEIFCDPAPIPCFGIFEAWSEPAAEWYQWILPDGTVEEGPVFDYSFLEPGVYVVCLTAGWGEDCIETICQEILIGEDPCSDDYLDFEWEINPMTNEVLFWPASESDPWMFTWTFGDGSSDDSDWMASHVYDGPGWYTVCLAVWYEDGCDLEVCHEIYIGEEPCSDYSDFTWSITPSGAVLFTPESDTDPIEWWWSFGDGTGSSEWVTDHYYSEPGVYIVCLTIVYADGCTEEICHEIVIGEGPCAGYEADYSWEWIPGTSDVFFISTGSEEETAWLWYNADGDIISDNNDFTFNFPEPGWYYICLVASIGDDCTSEVCYEIFVGEEGPCDDFFVGFEYEIFCDPAPIPCAGVFEGWSDPPADWYYWEMPDGSAYEGPSITYTFLEPGVYYICLTAGIGMDCVESYCQEVVVGEEGPCDGYWAEFEWEVTPDGAVIFYPFSEPDALEWEWDYGDGTSSSEWVTDHFYEPGVYVACLTVWFGEGCSTEVCHEIIIGDEPCDFFEAGYEWEWVPGTETVVFYDTSVPDAEWVNWWIDGVIVGTGPVFEYSFWSMGTYTVCMSAGIGEDCVDEYCAEVTVGETGPCDDYFVDFEWEINPETGNVIFYPVAEPEAVEWVWHFDELGADDDFWVTDFNFIEPGTYIVCLTVWFADGCEEVICHEIVIGEDDGCEGPEAFFEYETIPGGLGVEFINLSEGEIDWIVWDFGDGETSNDENPSYSYEEPGYYEVCLYVEYMDTCSDHYCLLLAVGEPEPCDGMEPDFEHELDPGSLGIFFFNTSTGFYDYLQWIFGNDETSEEENPYFIYEEPGAYEVCLVLKQGDSCINNSCKWVNVGTSGIGDDPADQIISLYPNPVGPGVSYMIADLDGEILIEDADLRIMDLNGRVLSTMNLRKGESRWEVLVDPQWASGMYIAEIKNAKKNFVQKWMLIK